MKRIPWYIAVLVLLTGCADYRWEKVGASEHERQLQLTACEARALKELPPDNVIKDVYTSSSLEDKQNDNSLQGNKERHNRIADANESERVVLVDNCMLQKGWAQVVVNQ